MASDEVKLPTTFEEECLAEEARDAAGLRPSLAGFTAEQVKGRQKVLRSSRYVSIETLSDQLRKTLRKRWELREKFPDLKDPDQRNREGHPQFGLLCSLESDIRAYEDAIDARRVAVPDRAASLLQPPETAPAPATPEPVAGTSRLKPDEAAPAAPAAMAKSNGRGRKRGPKGGYKTASQVAEIVARVAPGGDWKDKLGESCSALDRAELPYPKTWPKRDLPLHSWEDGATLEPGLAKKAIEYWLKAAKLRKNPDPETLS